MEKTIRKFRTFAEADKMDRDFYRKLTGQERLNILLELSKHEPERRLREFIELLNSRGVDYVIVGAHSLAFHGRPRYTGDLDILIKPSPENADKMATVLTDFGFAETGFKVADFMEPDQMMQLGRAPNRIDLMTGLSGVKSEDAFATRVSVELAGLPVFVLSKDLLIQNKRAVGRPQDLADLDTLG